MDENKFINNGITHWMRNSEMEFETDPAVGTSANVLEDDKVVEASPILWNEVDDVAFVLLFLLLVIL